MTKPRPALRVLVVDDDPVLTDLLPSLLSALGHTVDTANSGELALLRLSAPPPLDAVLIDLRMPGMDGAALAAAIAELPHPPQLIGMSGGEPTAEQATRFHAFLHKPFNINHLDQALNGSNSQPDARPAHLDTPAPIVLDIVIYNKLAASMPPAKMQDLYDRTLDFIRKTAPALDTASEAERSELVHSLHGSCAMVGAMELAVLAQSIEQASSAVPNHVQGSSLESSISYKILRAADRLERILNLL